MREESTKDNVFHIIDEITTYKKKENTQKNEKKIKLKKKEITT